MNPRDYQRLAERLIAGPPSAGPAECRSAISRAYYSGFNVGAELLRGLGFPIGKGAGAHGEVRHCLSNCGDLDVAVAASQLGDLHTERNRADYHLERTDVERPREAQAAVKKASNIIQSLDSAFTGPKRMQLQTTIRDWRKANGYP